MSDEPNNSDETPEEEPQMDSNFIPDFQAVAAHMQAEHAYYEQINSVRSHAVLTFLKELKEDQLLALRIMLQECYVSKRQAAAHIGAVTLMLDLKFDKCGACGEKHDEQLADLLGDKNTAEKTHEPRDIEALMKEYNLYMNEKTGYLQCTGCDMRYMSLKDRMLRPPGIEGCASCIDQQKWG